MAVECGISRTHQIRPQTKEDRIVSLNWCPMIRITNQLIGNVWEPKDQLCIPGIEEALANGSFSFFSELRIPSWMLSFDVFTSCA